MKKDRPTSQDQKIAVVSWSAFYSVPTSVKPFINPAIPIFVQTDSCRAYRNCLAV